MFRHSFPRWTRNPVNHPVTRAGLLILLGVMGLSWHLLTSPKEFHRDAWTTEVNSERKDLALKIQQAIVNSSHQFESQEPDAPWPDAPWVEASKIDIQLANDMRHTKSRLLTLIFEAERQLWFAQSGGLPEYKLPDLSVLQDIRELTRLLSVSERVHRLRATLLEADRRSHVAIHAIHNSGEDELTLFWNQELPWLETELRQIKDSADTKQRENENMSLKTRAFARALNVDLERLTQTALDIEIHRVDVWMDWAAAQPSRHLDELKVQATQQVARLESLSLMTKSMRSKPDPRLQSLQKSLRRMASVSNLDNW